MNIVKGIVTELRERRLWPVAVVLLLGLVAVPVLLSKSAGGASNTQASGTGSSGSNAQAVAVKLADGPGGSALSGHSRDPFAGGSTTTTALATVSTAAAGTSGAGAGTASVAAGAGGSATGSTAASGTGSSGSTGGSTGATSGGGSSSGTAPSAPATPARVTPAAKPAPAGLTATQSYAVSLEITNGSGGVQPIDPVERLSGIPSTSQPLLVYLGVEQGGQRVLFAVQPGAVVDGAGSCTPGPIDCEILSVPNGALETVSTGGATIAQFSISGISAVGHGSVAAANKARNAVSAVGARLLTDSPLTALTLFQYEPSVGAVVDMRNLTVGGN